MCLIVWIVDLETEAVWTQSTEDHLWEVQRVVTQLKRKVSVSYFMDC